MRILFLGYSRFVKKRALNAAISCGQFDAIALASRSSRVEDILQPHQSLKLYADYQRAIEDFKPDIVYISLVNSLHFAWAEKALLAGAHVIVDKPAFLTLKDTRHLISVADKQKRCLAEATVYAYHPQLNIAKKIFSDAHTEISRVSAFFTFPPLPDTDYRYQKKLGGGSLLDQGPYAVSMCRVFMGSPPENIVAVVNNMSANGEVEISFSVLASFSRGRSFVGHFGFDTEYRNSITLLGDGLSIDIDRVATIEPSLKNVLHIKEKNITRELVVPQYDNVSVFFEQFIKAIQSTTYTTFTQDLLQDAEAMERLRSSVLKKC